MARSDHQAPPKVIHESASRVRVLGAAPAVITAVVIVIFATLLWFRVGRGDLQQRYETSASLALASGDYHTSRVCFERLLQMRPDDPQFRYGLALSLRGLGQEVALPALDAQPAR